MIYNFYISLHSLRGCFVILSFITSRLRFTSANQQVSKLHRKWCNIKRFPPSPVLPDVFPCEFDDRAEQGGQENKKIKGTLHWRSAELSYYRTNVKSVCATKLICRFLGSFPPCSIYETLRPSAEAGEPF